MTVLEERMDGLFRRGRMRVASLLMTLGFKIHVALVDLGFAIKPELIGEPYRRVPIRPGLIVIALLICGLAFASIGGVWMIREAAPHREVTP